MSLLSKQKALHAKVSAEGSETLLSPIQLFSSFLRGASRSKSPRSVVKTFKSSLNDCTLKLSSGLFIKRVNLNISNRTQGFFYTSVVVPPWASGVRKVSRSSSQCRRRIKDFQAVSIIRGACRRLTGDLDFRHQFTLLKLIDYFHGAEVNEFAV